MVKKDGMILEKHHRGRLHPRFLRFLSPGNGGTEGGVKTIEERLGKKGGAFLNGKEGFCPLLGEPKGS